MKHIKTVMAAVACCAMFGCDSNEIKDPPLAITFRQGMLSKYVMQVNNLSTAEGIEVYVYVASKESSLRSGNVVVPANDAKEFGALELAWEFKAGDRGFVCPVKYGKKLFFEMSPNNRYRTWFGYNDIPEVDVAAQVRARRIAEHAEWLKLTTEKMAMHGRQLFVAITEANVEREAVGFAALWPTEPVQSSFKSRAKDALKGWKDKIVGKLGNDNAESAKPEEADIAESKFKTSGEYFDCLLDVRSLGTEKHRPYVTNVVVDAVSSAGPKGGALPAEAVRWSVLAVPVDYGFYELDDSLPVLVSVNFPCEKLRSFWDGKENADEVIPLSDVGDTRNESFVVVYKNGQAKALTSDKATLANIYAGPFNTLTNGYNRQIQYITPKGVVDAAGIVK